MPSLLLLALLLPIATAVTTCGGLVSIAPTLIKHAPTPFDFSQVSLILTTKSGLRKESIACVPNGFYVVPIYESGTYLLRPQHPHNWSFTPDHVTFTVDEDHHCGDNINFRITGFPLHGEVLMPRLDSCAAKATLPVTLTLKGMKTEMVTYPDENNRFVYEGLSPGEYVIEGKHPQRELSPVSITHTVEWGDAQLPPFRLHGATLSGHVHMGKPGIAMILTPKGRAPSHCAAQDPSCYQPLSPSGHFSFTDLPCGLFTLHIDVSSAAVSYALNTLSVDVAIGFDDVVIAPGTISVVGVRTSGSVVHGSSRAGIPGVLVLVDGAEVATTDAAGVFLWNSTNVAHSGPYHLQAFKRGHHFAPIPPYTIGETSPAIVAETYDVCGIVQTESAPPGSAVEILVGGAVVESVRLDADGAFCYAAAPGAYTIRPSSALGSLSPSWRSIRVTDSPIENADFYPLTVSVHGHVACFEKSACKNIVVSLVKADRPASIINSTNSEAGFVFPDIAPGSYLLSANDPAMCFEQTTIRVGASDSFNGIVKQTGVRVAIDSAHSAAMLLADSTKKDAIPLSIAAGKSMICVPSNIPNRFSLRSSPESPYRFSGEPILLDLKSAVHLSLEKVNISGTITIPSKIASPLEVEATSGKATLTTSATLLSSEGEIATLAYGFWAPVSQSYTIRMAASSDLVFSPSYRQIDVDNDPIQIEAFVGRAGLFRTGKIIPAVPGAKAMAFPAGEGEPLSQTIVNDQYRFGPLSDAADYHIEIVHPEFKFESIGNGDFRSVKLGSVRVAIVDDSASPVEGVLISLSGAGYRNNSLTGADGVVQFTDLPPLQFYLFPLLKEFLFRPHSQLVDLAEGDRPSYTFSAERTAFSVFGAVKSIAKRPLANVVISAAANEGDHVEETVSDASGNYRVRGLIAGRTYTLSVRSADVTDAVERSVPAQQSVTMPSHDLRGIDFIGYRRRSAASIFGTLPFGTSPTYLELRHHRTGDLQGSVSCSPAKRFFAFHNVPFGTFVITAADLDPIVVEVAGPVQLSLKAKEEAAPGPDHRPKSSIVTLLLGFAVVFALINHEALRGSVRKLQERRRSSAQPTQSWDIDQLPKPKTKTRR